MIYRFGHTSFDTDRCELARDGKVVPTEPQVFALIKMLIENRHRLVSRDEIIERIWNGRFVSDAAVSSRVKSARQALGDNGESQGVIRTLPRLGFRFVAEVVEDHPPARVIEPSQPVEPAAEPMDRPSIAVLRFSVLGDPNGPAGGLAEALPHDLIDELSRLRWLFVIARGSSFRFQDADLAAVREALKVRYCLSGVVELSGGVLRVTVELAETTDGGVIWTERYEGRLEDVHDIRQRIAGATLSALELQIPLHETQRARLKPPGDLSAWSAYHLGLHHLYRFDRAGNARAAALFEQAIARRPDFARAHAGLSFTHFEDAFLRFADDPAKAADQARRYAEQALEHDPYDPFCNLVMGRVFWLSGDLDRSLAWLDRAVQLNPNYAQGKYSKGWTETMMGDGWLGQTHADAAMALSPLDPLAYGMLGVRSMAHMVLDEPKAAAEWGERAARSPGAHALIELLAAVSHQLAGDEARAKAWAASARRRAPGLKPEDFLIAFPMRQPAARRRITDALTDL